MKNLLNLKHILAITVLLFIGVTFTSCDDDDDISVNPPLILNLEVGLSNSHIGYAGADLHLEAEIEAEAGISTIAIEMHLEDGYEEEYEYTWTEFEGLLNTNFHKHFDIPSDATIGEYHFHFVVTDMKGNQTSEEFDIEIQELVDEEAPVMTVSSAPTANQVFSNGETISIAGDFTDNVGLGGYLVALVRVDDAIEDADVAATNSKVIVMQHSHDFDSYDQHSFSESIVVGAANDNNTAGGVAPIEGDNAWESGEYYILVRVKDGAGTWTFSSHYPITISL